VKLDQDERLTCVECGRELAAGERGWRAYLTVDEDQRPRRSSTGLTARLSSSTHRPTRRRRCRRATSRQRLRCTRLPEHRRPGRTVPRARAEAVGREQAEPRPPRRPPRPRATEDPAQADPRSRRTVRALRSKRSSACAPPSRRAQRLRLDTRSLRALPPTRASDHELALARTPPLRRLANPATIYSVTARDACVRFRRRTDSVRMAEAAHTASASPIPK
jgi:hypothetical protein